MTARARAPCGRSASRTRSTPAAATSARTNHAQPGPLGHDGAGRRQEVAAGEHPDVVDGRRQLVQERRGGEDTRRGRGNDPVARSDPRSSGHQRHRRETHCDERQGVDATEAERSPEPPREVRVSPLRTAPAEERREAGEEEGLCEQLGRGEAAEEGLGIERGMNGAREDAQRRAADAPAHEEQRREADEREEAHLPQVQIAADRLQSDRQPHREEVEEVEADRVAGRRGERHPAREARVGPRVVVLEAVPEQRLPFLDGHFGDERVMVGQASRAGEVLRGAEVDRAVAAGDRGVDGGQEHREERGRHGECQPERHRRGQGGPHVAQGPAPMADHDTAPRKGCRESARGHGREPAHVRQHEEAAGQEREARHPGEEGLSRTRRPTRGRGERHGRCDAGPGQPADDGRQQGERRPCDESSHVPECIFLSRRTTINPVDGMGIRGRSAGGARRLA